MTLQTFFLPEAVFLHLAGIRFKGADRIFPTSDSWSPAAVSRLHMYALEFALPLH